MPLQTMLMISIVYAIIDLSSIGLGPSQTRWKLMMPQKSPVSHTVPTRSKPDLPNTEKDLTESTGVVPAKDPPKVKSEESSNNVREYEL